MVGVSETRSSGQMNPASDVLTGNGHPDTAVSQRTGQHREITETAAVLRWYTGLYRWRWGVVLLAVAACVAAGKTGGVPPGTA